MDFLRIFLSRCAALFRRRRLDEELDEELQMHLELAIEEHLRRGLQAEDARAAALREFGGVTQIQERYRERRGVPLLESGWQDLRFGLRHLRRNPGFALTVVLSLALGVGATVSVFSITYAVLVHPYPYADADRIVYPMLTDPSGMLGMPELTGAQVRELAKADVAEKLSARINRNMALTDHDFPESVMASCQSGDSFPMLGVPALLGRNLGPADSRDGQEPQPVLMLNYKFWQRHFNGDPGVVGHTLELDHKQYTIVGVAGPRFGWGGNNGNIDVYLPQKLSNDLPADVSFYVFFKLRPGITRAAADAQLQPLFERFAEEVPENFPRHFTVKVQRLKDGTIRSLGEILDLLFAAVSLLLAIGCGNASILLLARGAVRQHELGIRSAAGAGAGRIFRQLLTESLLLSFAGSALGVVLAYSTLGGIIAWLPVSAFPNEADFHINMPVLLFSAGLALLTGMLFGVFPAVQMVTPEINPMMQASTHKIAGSVRGTRLHGALIVGQIALTLLLLTAAGVAIEGFVRMMRVPLGYDPHAMVSVSIPLHENAYTQWAERVQYFTRLRDKVAELPGVVSVAISTNATPPDSGWNQTFALRGRPNNEEQKALVHFVGPDYFGTLHIPLLQGRLWDASEVKRGATLVLVNRSFAERYYPHGDALGQSLEVPGLKGQPPDVLAAPGSDGWMEVIGVVADSVDDGVDKPIRPAIFMPYGTFMFMGTQLLIRSRSDPEMILQSVRKQIAAVNADQEALVHGNGDLEWWIRQEPDWARSRLLSGLFVAFAGLALVLAAVGLYSVVSYSVVQRTNEFGIRLALGAQRSDVAKIVLTSAGARVGPGIGIGFGLSVAFTHLIAHWVENSGHDLLVITAVCLLLVVVSAVACLLPANRAASVDPMTALRCE
jgi:predicted permease